MSSRSLLAAPRKLRFRRNLMELLGAKEVSDLTGVPVGTLRYWRHSDIGPASFTLGRRVVYRRDEVLRWISERESATRRGGDAA
jgi:predicted DNA-binding transcriptional regulator AlpA